MSASTVSISLAVEEDALAIASVMTAAFAARDAAYPVIWGAASEGTHDMIAAKELFTPVQREDRVTFKAVDDASGKPVGFVIWTMPKEKVVVSQPEEEKKGVGLPDLPGVNTELWREKLAGLGQYYDRDVDVTKDMRMCSISLLFLVCKSCGVRLSLMRTLDLSYFFVHPDYQRRGIGSKLLQWGKEKGDALGAKIWISSTPQARPVYEKNGWKVVESHEIDLDKHGGEGSYVRYWMLRSPP